jgi:two-component system NarL family sensor kinase
VVSSTESRGRLDRLLTAVAVALAAAAVVAVLTAARLALIVGASWQELVSENEATNAILGLAFGLLGALAVADRPRNGLSWLFVAEGSTNALTVLAARWVSYAEQGRPEAPLVGLAAWVGAYIWMPGFVLALVVLPLIYPTGSWPSPRWRFVGRVALIFTGAALLLAFTTNEPIEGSYPGFTNPLGLFPWSDSGTPIRVVVALAVGFALIGLVALVQRFRHGGPIMRAQVGWLFLALAINLAVNFLPSELPSLVAAALLVLALGLAVVRYRLYAVERVFNRTAVYGALTAGVVGIFAIFAWLVGGRLNDTVFGTVLAAAVVALGVGPAREWLQRLVDRAMYGRRSDPYGALAGLGRQLEQAPAESGLLTSIAAGVADALRLPYVAIILADEETPAAIFGTLRGRSVDLPLVHASQQIGQLTVGLRRGERRLTERDTALLADFARLVAAAAKEVSLAADLRRSRERLVIAREEERRRLRRELHDGVGPALAGLALGVGAANRAVARGDATAGPLLTRVEAETAGLLADVRRIAHDLRPAALDELGLVGALRQRCEAITDASGGAPVVRMEADGLPALPAAVEVAAWRIVTEALANTVRHASASRCTVRLIADGCLHLEVTDNGRGLPSVITPGLGLSSMAERAAELGGTCIVESGPTVGTVVRAELPLEVTAR